MSKDNEIYNRMKGWAGRSERANVEGPSLTCPPPVISCPALSFADGASRSPARSQTLASAASACRICAASALAASPPQRLWRARWDIVGVSLPRSKTAALEGRGAGRGIDGGQKQNSNVN